MRRTHINATVLANALFLQNRKSSQDPHRGFGYIEFALAEDALEAIDNMDQSELYGRVIKVNQAKPQKAAGEKLGSKTAIWEQVRSVPRSRRMPVALRWVFLKRYHMY